jgi:drug/metabolite transporter (DMT)-like permease
VLPTTALGYLIFFRLLVRTGAVNGALISLPVPVTALLLATVALGEAQQWHTVAGAILIFCGFATLDGRLPWRS